MALPIAETPVIEGKDAKKFMDMIENPEHVSEEEIAQLKEMYEKIKNEVTFIEEWQ